MNAVGMIGLGLLGHALASRLLAAGESESVDVVFSLDEAKGKKA